MKKYYHQLLMVFLVGALIVGGYTGLTRYRAEVQNRTVEIVLDLNDTKALAAAEKKPLQLLLKELKKNGIYGFGVFEETLAEANAQGELYYAKGSGVSRLKLLKTKAQIKPDRTYLYLPEPAVRQRVANQLKWVLTPNNVKFIGRDIIEVNALPDEIATLGLGISESQSRFLINNGFAVIPRLWNDPRYQLGNIDQKIAALKPDDLIIFDGEEILGWPDSLPVLASALKTNGLKYGFIEIVKQDGDARLRQLMGTEVVRVQSVPKDELKKLTKEEAVDRFVRAAKERSVRLIYLRPFLPPQVRGRPIQYNLNYFAQLKTKLEKAGFVLGKVEAPVALQVADWQILLLGLGVVAGALMLLEAFIACPVWIGLLLLLYGLLGILAMIFFAQLLLLQKILAFSAGVVFPALAVINTFSPKKNAVEATLKRAIFLAINVLAETAVGVFIVIGLLADTRFMLGVETFPGVKIVLLMPLVIVALYFFWRSGEGSIQARFIALCQSQVSLGLVVVGLAALAALAVLVARSGNFILPVPGFEKIFRNWLEVLLYMRPRTKEFFVGYPFLIVTAYYYLRADRRWLWILAALGTIAPVSVLNTFSHIHAPLLVSLIRTINGLVIGLLVGAVVWWLLDSWSKKKEPTAQA